MKIEVTKKDILQGTPRNGQWCPIACAIRRQVPRANLDAVYVGGTAVRVIGKVITLPDRVQRFVKRYDKLYTERSRMRPFSFELSIRTADRGSAR